MNEEDDLPPLVPLALSRNDTLSQAQQCKQRVRSDASISEKSVGITIITGYLGAGKSTLVNYVLNEKHGKRIAVILNEFGEELGIERAMINEGEKGTLVEEWIELPNGCVCCSVKHSFVQALEQLLERRERFDHILLETTGLANPGPIASVLWIDDQLESPVHLDSIITVVDAKHIRQQLYQSRDADEITEAHLQLAFADVVIINKVDLIGEDESGSYEALVKEIQSINSCAKIVKSIHCNINLEHILDCKSYDPERFSELFRRNASFDEVEHHNPKVTTLSLSSELAVDLQKVNDWLSELLWEKSAMEIYRIKGVLYIQDSRQIHLLQAVQELYEIIPGRSWRQDERCGNKLVFIGKYLNQELLQSSFKRCV